MCKHKYNVAYMTQLNCQECMAIFLGFICVDSPNNTLTLNYGLYQADVCILR